MQFRRVIYGNRWDRARVVVSEKEVRYRNHRIRKKEKKEKGKPKGGRLLAFSRSESCDKRE